MLRVIARLDVPVVLVAAIPAALRGLASSWVLRVALAVADDRAHAGSGARHLTPVRLATIAGEDVYFVLHSGFDWESLRSAPADNKSWSAGR